MFRIMEPLTRAVKTGSLETLSAELRQDIKKINIPVDLDANTLLHIAASRGDFSKCILLMRHGASQCMRNGNGNTAIIEAVIGKHRVAVSILNRTWNNDDHIAGQSHPPFADINDPVHVTPQGETVLMIAAKQHNNGEMLRLLVRLLNRCVVDKTNGKTALMMAVCAGLPENVQIIATSRLHDIDNTHVSIRDNRGMTALHLAMTTEMRNDVRYHTTMHLIHGGGEPLINMGNGNLFTALHLAVNLRHEQNIIALLVRGGANIHANAGLKGTPFFTAMRRNRPSVCKILLKRGTKDKYTELETRDALGKTALLEATKYENNRVVHLLLNKGANCQAYCDYYGSTALHWAAGYGKLNICKEIIHMGGFNRHKNRERMTPMECTHLYELDTTDSDADEDPNSWEFVDAGACRTLLERTAELISERIQAFAQSQHDRLGANSGARVLSSEIVKMIHDEAHGKDA